MENRFFAINSLLRPSKRRQSGYSHPSSIVERFAASFDAVNYTVPGIVSPIQQPTGMVCWATVTTMMINWRNQRSSTIETVIANTGTVYLNKVRNNQGLSSAEKIPFLRAAGLTPEFPQSLSIAGWEQMMRNYGPIWVTTAEGSDASFGIHARIIHGIQGDGTSENTTLSIVDPGTGTAYREKFSDFLVKFEREVRVSADWDGRIQIVHFSTNTAIAKSFAAVNYTVPGIVGPIQQPTGMVCWATVTTMMINWRNQSSSAIETVIANTGTVYLNKVRNNQGLSSAEKIPFLRAAGLTPEFPQSLSIAGWEQMMRNYGPIWVTTAEGSDANFGIHARIIHGIQGDGTPENTTLSIVDPGTGTAYPEKFSDFLVKFEREVRVSADWDGRIQIVHFAARTATAKSFTATQSVISATGIALIKRLEGFRAQKYNDQAGHCTIGYGTLIHKGNCNGDASEQPYANGVTDERATELLMTRVGDFQRTINEQITVSLNQNQFDALVSFVYNIGSENFRRSTLRRLLNQGSYTSVPTEMRKWVKIRQNGALVDSQGLVNRRNAEIELYNTAVGSVAQSFSFDDRILFSGDLTVQEDFIQQYSQNAIDSMQQTRVPASVTLAQAALESGWGRSAPRFNFFGIKAGASWTGERQLLTTTEIHSDNDRSRHPYPEIISIEQYTDNNGNVKYRWRVKDNFRAYANAVESFNDHGNFLVNNARYREAFNHTGDARQFVREIARAGYATDPSYATSLIQIIEHNNLIRFDTVAPVSTANSNTVQEFAGDILSNPGRVSIPANIRTQLESIRTNGSYTLNGNTFTPSLSLLQSISQMLYFSLDHNRSANPAFGILSYIRPASSHHSNGTAVDLTHIDGIRIDVRNQQQCLDAVICAINNLASGSYALGLPRPPYADGAGADHDFTTYNRHITVYANTQPPTLLPEYQNLPTTGNFFLPNRWNEHSPTGSTATDLNHITNETSRAALRTAINNASGRGVNIRYLFADALDHLHIQAL
ncbi:Flagellum-specific peptidoglycan hydrolase FlgJ [Chitinophaga sp. CF118]|uniref:papain-like cysteine protease family protein n=1 Tax=Chitinophaga sp. CF118 TaxID=1884367 RepID=UPI0008DF72D6|nr:papain-like cysteine protease family protein [Chitinophaga sp. CF118]SFD84088.1 Flagellum-specific peptidoglycan hydrolase FlgJ [Chitinophaga sp. CF118]